MFNSPSAFVGQQIDITWHYMYVTVCVCVFSNLFNMYVAVTIEIMIILWVNIEVETRGFVVFFQTRTPFVMISWFLKFFCFSLKQGPKLGVCVCVMYVWVLCVYVTLLEGMSVFYLLLLTVTSHDFVSIDMRNLWVFSSLCVHLLYFYLCAGWGNITCNRFLWCKIYNMK